MAKITNEQKYKTAEERVEAFRRYCNGKLNCSGCEVKEEGIWEKYVCFAYWLALEADEEQLEPCPFCEGKCVEATPCEEHPHIVKCVECGYHTPEYAYKTFADAIAAHNRVARAVRAAESKKGE